MLTVAGATIAALLAITSLGHSSPRGTAAAGATSRERAPVLVVGSLRRQRIDGWGSALTADLEPLINEADVTPRLRARLYSLIFGRLRENVFRVFLGGFGPEAIGPPASGGAGVMARRAAFIRTARARGARIMLTGADAPSAWKDGKRLRAGMEARYGDYLVDWAQRLRAVGARGDYLAVGNEVSNEDFFNMSDTQAALVYGEMARRIQVDGLPIRLATGDNENFADAHRYSELQLQDPLVARYAAVAATHAYGNWGSSGPQAQRDLARLARSRGLRLWMTEHLPSAPPPGSCGAPGKAEDTIGSALALANDITTLMSGPAQPNAYLTLRAVARDHGPGIAAIVLTPPTPDCRRPTPASRILLTKRFYAELQYTRAAPPRSFRLAVRGPLPPGVRAIAFRAPDGSKRLVVLNETEASRRVRLDFGRRYRGLSARRTSASESYSPVALGRSAGGPKIVVARAQSITTFVARSR